MPRYADVALPVTIDREFTYLVPPDLEPSALIGSRAIVPFGRKYATGLIVGRPDSTTVTLLKPLHDILDPVPVISAELLDLCRWIASYYLCPLGEVLKAAMPQGFSAASRRIVRLNPAASAESINAATKASGQRAQILSLLRTDGPTFASRLGRTTGVRNINAVLNDLVRAGIVEAEEEIPRPSTTPRFIEFIRIGDLSAEAIRQALSTLPPRKKNSRRLLDSVLALAGGATGEIAIRDLLKSSGSSLSAFRELKEAGILHSITREVSRQQEYGTEEQTLHIQLNTAQQMALDALTNAMSEGGSAFLLHGVTGSGKTQVYIEAIRRCVAAGRTAIVLVPEIALTPQMMRRFKSHFSDDVVVVHSRMSLGERHDAWRRAYTGKSRIVIGPRSAVFAPLSNLGLIVVDEEHEASYKQFDSSPRYNARDVAVVRAGKTGAVVLLGSATPSAESYYNVQTGKYRLLEMPERIDNVPMPVIAIVDMAAERKRAYVECKAALPEAQRGKLKNFVASPISSLLREKIADRLSRREGIILLQNRRGFAPFVECAECGYVEMCDNCNVTLTYHLTKKHLRCHYCGLTRVPHILCPSCGGTDIALRGVGTQKVEKELATLFPPAAVLRMDLDTTSRKGAHDRILRKFGEGGADILLGTQMVAKGLDFARVTLVGVVSADTQMLLPDFRASERTFQLLTQVAGRAGRSMLKGEVLIQTYQPHHYTLRHVVDHDFRAFYEEELTARRELDYPPFSRMALVESNGENEERVRAASEQFAAVLKRTAAPVTILGPAPAVIAKLRNRYRWHVMVKSPKEKDPAGATMRHALQAAAATMAKDGRKDVRLIIDVDPMGTM
ncbi:MAG: primosomal protein N' [Bacteroidota bacterium]